jgi:hypothetical protein
VKPKDKRQGKNAPSKPEREMKKIIEENKEALKRLAEMERKERELEEGALQFVTLTCT